MNVSPASPAELRSASLLPSEIVREKPVQVVKFDRVVVAVRMQHHAVRRRACLFVADIGVAHETSMVIDGSPPIRQWLAYEHPCQRFAEALTGNRA